MTPDISDIQDHSCAICQRKTTEWEDVRLFEDAGANIVPNLLCGRCMEAVRELTTSQNTARRALEYLIKRSADRSWDDYFIKMASLVASRSKDPSTQVGAVLVRGNVVIATGYNGFPRGCDDNAVERYQRPEKYTWTAHAEENALLNACREGMSTVGATMYVTPLQPCSRCVRGMIQAGVERIVCNVSSLNARWREDFVTASQMMKEAGLAYCEI